MQAMIWAYTQGPNLSMLHKIKDMPVFYPHAAYVQTCLCLAQVYALEIEEYMRDFSAPYFRRANVDQKARPQMAPLHIVNRKRITAILVHVAAK